MTDLGDIAAAIEAERIGNGLRRIDPTLRAGVAGECDDCGELMPRLVDGRCGFCRDGRRPPPERYAAAQARLQPTTQPKETIMPNPPPGPNFKQISILAKDELLAGIRVHASEHGLSEANAAKALLLRAISDASEDPTVIIEPASVSKLSTADLLTELGRRIDAAVPPDVLSREVARANAAETKLALLRGLLDEAAS